MQYAYMTERVSPELRRQIGRRLRQLRETDRRGFKSAAEAARRLGIAESTYQGHENGSRGLTRSLARYARFYEASLEWLLTGNGAPRIGQKSRVQELHDALPRDIQLQAIEWLEFLVRKHNG